MKLKQLILANKYISVGIDITTTKASMVND